MRKVICFVAALTVVFAATLHLAADLAVQHPNSRWARGTQQAYGATARLCDRACDHAVSYNPLSFAGQFAVAGARYLFQDTDVRTACHDNTRSCPVARTNATQVAAPVPGLFDPYHPTPHWSTNAPVARPSM